ncbi:MAG: ATP-binding protein [Desulfobacterales bacterium]|nr:ATP-binding protein [Desulfobacterales bacterium]
MIKERKSKSLFRQIYPTYLLIVVISVISVSWYAADALRQFYLDQAKIDLQARAHLFEKHIEGYLSPLNTSAIDFSCKAIGRRTGTRMTVILPDGEVVGDTDETPQNMDNHGRRPEILQAMKEGLGSSIRYSRTFRLDMMYVAIPFQKEGSTAAVIRTALPVSFVDEALKGVRNKIALGGLMVALLTAVASLFVSRYISRPIEEIKKGAEHFARGELKYRLPHTGTAELSSLARSLNQMAGQIEEKIKTIVHQRAELEAVLSSMVEGVVAIDQDERVLNVNAAAARMFNGNVGSLQGRLIQEVIRNAELQQFVRNALAGGRYMESDIILRKNNERVISASGTPLQDAAGSPRGILVVLHDVTRLRKLENMRRDFVANVSHEIKTPLTTIKGFVETLLQGAVDNHQETERFLGIIAKHVDRLNSIVDDLLSLSRIEQEGEKKEIRFETVGLKRVLGNAVQICQTKAGEKNISLDLNCDKGFTALLDPALFEQAAVNLIDNAIKFSQAGRTVTISCEKSDGSEIAIHFKDHGIGIPRQHLDRLFERFYRVDTSRSRNLGGTGLGLAIVKHIVQAHGGRITVESAPGAGSVFSIFLPLKNGSSSESNPALISF